jgi:hypothetical protein
VKQTQEEMTWSLAERWCSEVAHRDNTAVARRLYRKQVVDGMYRLDAGALLDDFLHFLEDVGRWRYWQAPMARRSNER